MKTAVKRRGYVDGSELARVFAWMRPNDLIWNYWVNNYLLGNTPPAFDILYWNADTTRLWRIKHPTLVLAGNDDPLVPLPLAQPQPQPQLPPGQGHQTALRCVDSS